MNLNICHYIEQQADWPQSGRHIMAQFDDESIIVYQAYRPAIARHAVENQRFGGEFSYARMSWIKPNFLWMMYRAGWATKEGQEHILAVRLKRLFFEELLENAVASSFGASGFDSHETWSHAVAHSDVRLQWDPDHHPNGNKLERRAIQLGLRGEMLNRYGSQEVLSIEDITPFVIQQRQCLPGNLEELQMPSEQVFQPFSPKAAETVGCMPCQ
ncbi:protein of unknown function [Prosthecobacter debontii]|uniref:DUF4291 domain-containing protein n=1 Tax=Prosthecobacter debontii TaxID=48467 RepID=A0A1T4X967_9BACT|nr:DUF4291 domain-containing protein [Prosthecobacter debontii]SKA85441.1 protein of unknown function [Prosthecobacter debontii]